MKKKRKIWWKSRIPCFPLCFLFFSGFFVFSCFSYFSPAILCFLCFLCFLHLFVLRFSYVVPSFSSFSRVFFGDSYVFLFVSLCFFLCFSYFSRGLLVVFYVFLFFPCFFPFVSYFFPVERHKYIYCQTEWIIVFQQFPNSWNEANLGKVSPIGPSVAWHRELWFTQIREF